VDEKIKLIKQLCESRIERLTVQMEKASYWKKPWFWNQRLWWKDHLDSINKLDKVQA
jgi:hypothetical protein